MQKLRRAQQPTPLNTCMHGSHMRNKHTTECTAQPPCQQLNIEHAAGLPTTTAATCYSTRPNGDALAGAGGAAIQVTKDVIQQGISRGIVHRRLGRLGLGLRRLEHLLHAGPCTRHRVGGRLALGARGACGGGRASEGV